jgi:hypothetical protein
MSLPLDMRYSSHIFPRIGMDKLRRGKGRRLYFMRSAICPVFCKSRRARDEVGPQCEAVESRLRGLCDATDVMYGTPYK